MDKDIVGVYMSLPQTESVLKVERSAKSTSNLTYKSRGKGYEAVFKNTTESISTHPPLEFGLQAKVTVHVTSPETL